MKKYLIGLLALMLALGFTGCSMDGGGGFVDGGTILNGTWFRVDGDTRYQIKIDGNEWVYSQGPAGSVGEYSKGTWKSWNTSVKAASSGIIQLVAEQTNPGGSGWQDVPEASIDDKTTSAAYALTPLGNMLTISGAIVTTTSIWGSLEGTYQKQIDLKDYSAFSGKWDWHSFTDGNASIITYFQDNGGTVTIAGTVNDSGHAGKRADPGDEETVFALAEAVALSFDVIEDGTKTYKLQLVSGDIIDGGYYQQTFNATTTIATITLYIDDFAQPDGSAPVDFDLGSVEGIRIITNDNADGSFNLTLSNLLLYIPKVDEGTDAPYIITGGPSGFNATKNGARIGMPNMPIQDLINAIRDHANGADCGIHFGDGATPLDIGDNSISFENPASGTPWGKISLSGKLTSSSPTATVAVGPGVEVESIADIMNTNGGTGGSGGGNGGAALNNNGGTVDINGGTISGGNGGSGGSGNNNGGNAINTSNNGTTNINGGTITGGNGSGTGNGGSGTNNSGGSTTNINGGTVTGGNGGSGGGDGGSGTNNSGGNTSISGGTVTGGNGGTGGGSGGGNGGSGTNNSGGNTSISGGTITGGNGIGSGSGGSGTNNSGGNTGISGGTIRGGNGGSSGGNGGHGTNNSSGTTNISGGTISGGTGGTGGSGGGGGHGTSNSGGTTNINGGTVNSGGGGGGSNGDAVNNSNGGTVNIDGEATINGTITGVKTGSTVLDGTWRRGTTATYYQIKLDGNDWVYSEGPAGSVNEYSKGTWESVSPIGAPPSSGIITLTATHRMVSGTWQSLSGDGFVNTASYSINANGDLLTISDPTLTTAGVWGTLAGAYEKQKIPVADDFTITGTGTVDFDGGTKTVTVVAKSGKTTGTVTVYYTGTGGTTYPKDTTAPSAVGTYAVTFDVTEADGWLEATGLSAGTLTITDGTPAIADFAGTWNAIDGRTIVFAGDTFDYTGNGGTPTYSGTFSVSGSTITFNETSLGTANGDFTLSGDTLTLSNHTWDSSVEGTYTKE